MATSGLTMDVSDLSVVNRSSYMQCICPTIQQMFMNNLSDEDNEHAPRNAGFNGISPMAHRRALPGPGEQ